MAHLGALSRYRARTWWLVFGRNLAAYLATLLTVDQVVMTLWSSTGTMHRVWFWPLLVLSVLVAAGRATYEMVSLRQQVYVLDPTHSLTVRVDDFRRSMAKFPTANIAFGAHDTFATDRLLPDSLHAIAFRDLLHPTPADQTSHDTQIGSSASAAPGEDGSYAYGTVAVLQLCGEAGAPSTEPAARRAYLVVNSTRGVHSFAATGDVHATDHPLRLIRSKHVADHDVSRTLLVPLIGTGGSSAFPPMQSLLTVIDDYFDEWLKVRRANVQFDPIPRVVISLRPEELQDSRIDLRVVHAYVAAKRAAYLTL